VSGDTLEITVHGRQYHVACAAEERAALREAADLLDRKMAEIAKQTKSTGERLAVMTALNLAHELLANRRQPGVSETFDSSAIARRIESIEARLDAVLGEQQDLLF
jgi:cell division protein ZapA